MSSEEGHGTGDQVAVERRRGGHWTLVWTRHEAIISDQDRRIDHIIISAHTPGGTAACVWQIKTKIHLIECHVVMPGPSGRALLC